jgi:uncharacterized membrane protein YfcA
MVHDLLFFAGGLVAGVVNTLAGNGSAITLSLLLGSGLNGSVANATNRVGVLAQTVTAVLSVRPSRRKRFLMRASRRLALPTFAGSLLGGVVGSLASPTFMEASIAVVMTAMLFTLFTKPSRWLAVGERREGGLMSWLTFFVIGLYGGFVQMGIGIMMLAALVLVQRWTLRDANVIKLILALVLALPATLIYLFMGDIVWSAALWLAVGSALGAWIGARYVVRIPAAQPAVRWVVMAAVVFGAARALYNLWGN